MARLSFFTVIALTIAGLASAAPIQETDLSNKVIVKRDNTYSGTATFFHPATEGGSTGACGPEADNDSPIVALNAPQYGDLDGISDWCGQQIEITGPAGTTTATITDACPECGHGSLDLTPAVFAEVVGDEDLGVGEITWTVI
jgi:expansin (peptidoglycan-binding protein)